MKNRRKRKPAPKPERIGKPTTEQMAKWLAVYPHKTSAQISVECNNRLNAVGAPGRFVIRVGVNQVIYVLDNHSYSLAEGLVKLQEYEDEK